MSKLVFLHSGVERETQLIASFLGDCNVQQVTEETVLESFDVNGLTHVAFVWHYPGYNRLPFFEDAISEQGLEHKQPMSMYFSDRVVEFMRSLPSGCKVDLLTCNLGSDSHYDEEVQRLEGELDVDIRYSVDQTGNNPLGNWVLESDNVDV